MVVQVGIHSALLRRSHDVPSAIFATFLLRRCHLIAIYNNGSVMNTTIAVWVCLRNRLLFVWYVLVHDTRVTHDALIRSHGVWLLAIVDA